jgi:cullin-associated NEDD8-dissociated protein 1
MSINAAKLLAKIDHYDKVRAAPRLPALAVRARRHIARLPALASFPPLTRAAPSPPAQDERYMCLNDLNAALSALPAGARLDHTNETKLLAAVLERLDKDTSNDVQALAVKTLSGLVTRIKEEAVSNSVDQLSRQVVQGRDELRDVYAIGLKTVIADVPNTPPMAAAVLRAIVPRLLGQGLRAPQPVAAPAPAAGAKAKAPAAPAFDRKDSRPECLDITQELIRRFGDALQPAEAADLKRALLECVLEQDGAKAVVRKRASAAPWRR